MRITGQVPVRAGECREEESWRGDDNNPDVAGTLLHLVNAQGGYLLVNPPDRDRPSMGMCVTAPC